MIPEHIAIGSFVVALIVGFLMGYKTASCNEEYHDNDADHDETLTNN